MINGILDSNVVLDLLREVAETVTWYESLGKQQFGIVPIV